MGPAPGRLPPAPKTMPSDDASAAPAQFCETCKHKDCKNDKWRGQNYACWCGGNVAPARDAKLEDQIPAKESEWPDWVDKNNLPRPLNSVDRCCMDHDLRLGQVRQQNHALQYDSDDSRVAAINGKLAKCFSGAKGSGVKAGIYKTGGAAYFNHISGSQNPGGGFMGGYATEQEVGMANAASNSAASGAMWSALGGH